MRIIVLGLVAALVGACVSAPQLEPLSGDALGTSPAPSTPGAPNAPISDAATGDEPLIDLDGAVVSEPDASAPDASIPPPDAGPPPPAATCPPAGAPAGTACCGGAGKPPPCIGLACGHCNDCVSVGCAAGAICCAVTAGKSGKYKSMSCRSAPLAGACP